jgi:hypothetical protein
MKKLLVIILMAFTTITFAHEGKYSMAGDGESVYILNVENGAVKKCHWGVVHLAERDDDFGKGVVCSMWRLNKDDASNTYIYKTSIGY